MKKFVVVRWLLVFFWLFVCNHVEAEFQASELFTKSNHNEEPNTPDVPDDRIKVIAFDTQTLRAVKERTTVRLELFDRSVVEIELEPAKRRGRFMNSTILVGKCKNDPLSHVSIALGPKNTSRASTLTGNIICPTKGNYALRSNNPGQLTIQEVRIAKRRSEGVSEPPQVSTLTVPDTEGGRFLIANPDYVGGPTHDGSAPKAGVVPQGPPPANVLPCDTAGNQDVIEPAPSPNDPVEIDVMVGWTAWFGDQAEANNFDLFGLADLLVVDTNQFFEDSGVNLRLNLVYKGDVTTDPEKDSEYLKDNRTLYDELRFPNDGNLDEVHALRFQHAADLVFLITAQCQPQNPTDDACTLFYDGVFAESNVAMHPMAGFGIIDLPVTNINPGTNIEFANLVGRTLGSFSQHPSIADQVIQTENGWPAFYPETPRAPYAYGYAAPIPGDPNAWYETIMVWELGFWLDLFNPDNERIFVPRFSSPNLDYNGYPLGVDYDVDPINAADNVRSLNEAFEAANFLYRLHALVIHEQVYTLGHPNPVDGSSSLALEGIADVKWRIGRDEDEDGLTEILGTELTQSLSLPLGQNIIQLVLTDTSGNTSCKQFVTNVVNDQPLVADAGEDFTVYDVDSDGLESVTLTVTAPDPDNDGFQFLWFNEAGDMIADGNSFDFDFGFTVIELPIGVHNLRVLALNEGNNGVSGSSEDWVTVTVTGPTLVGKEGVDYGQFTMDYYSIKDAAWQAEEGEFLVVFPGTYTEDCDIRFNKENITLKSLDGPEATVINCASEGNKRALTFSSGNDGIVVEGFTIESGTSLPGWEQGGGCISISSTNPVIRGNIIRDCTATGTDPNSQFDLGGGAILVKNSEPVIENNLFYNNHSESTGGTITFYRGGVTAAGPCDSPAGIFPKFYNNTVASSTAELFGPGVYSHCVAADVTNSVIWDVNSLQGDVELDVGVFASLESSAVNSPTVSYSCVQGGWDGDGERALNEDPKFVDAENFDFSLGAKSYCIDAGNSDVAPSNDLAGWPRNYDDPGVANLGIGELTYTDIGAFERQQNSNNQIPYAIINVEGPFDGDVLPGETVSFDGLQSYDPDNWQFAISNANASYQWSTTPAGPTIIGAGTDSVEIFFPEETPSGWYQIQLIVTDGISGSNPFLDEGLGFIYVLPLPL